MYRNITSHKLKKNQQQQQQQPQYFLVQSYSKWSETCFLTLYLLLLAQILFTVSNVQQCMAEEILQRTDSLNGAGREYVAFSALEKQVVDSLIKQWAPVVWLAPEEKFMPLGVEEFLAHVHPESKGNNQFTPGMPIGDTSEKSYLVTNAKIDELLENDNSFIYGRNPNISPVPVYAVVTLCNRETATNVAIIKNSLELPAKPTILEQKVVTLSSAAPFEKTSVQEAPELNFNSGPTENVKPTRGPYIPVTLSPDDQLNGVGKRSSRLFPMFQRVKRNAPDLSLQNSNNLRLVPKFELAIGETTHSVPSDVLKRNSESTLTSATEQPEDGVNNFIANLADNVKFTMPMSDHVNVLSNENFIGSQSTMHSRKPTVVPSFHVTFWMFYPYSQGKNMCTLKLGPFGRIPFPAVYGYCIGRKKDIGSHIGDWEHMTLYFSGSAEPEAMYVSAHDAGAYYAYNRLTGSFEFKKQETRKGILQRPNFPKTVTTFNNHPVLFAAKGSHGLWTAPGKHRFVKVARLYDINGFGTPWNTWKHVEITYENLKTYGNIYTSTAQQDYDDDRLYLNYLTSGRSFAPTWLSFKGKWGNPKSKCHPFRRIGLNFCEFADGPTGIPLKEAHFQCGLSYARR